MESKKNIWDKNWECQRQIHPKEILNSRFCQEAYLRIKNFIDKKDKLILEAGCGTGRLCCLLAKNFPDSKVIGIDISPNSLKIANRLKEYMRILNVNFEMGNVFQMPYLDNYFDLVFNDGVIEHFSLEDTFTYKDVLREMVRITKPGGKIIVDVPNWYCFPHTIYKWLLEKIGKQFAYGYEKSFKHNELIRLFEEFNLTNLQLTGYYTAHAFYRLIKYSQFFAVLGKITDILDTKYSAKIFGFMILIKGEKQKL